MSDRHSEPVHLHHSTDRLEPWIKSPHREWAIIVLAVTALLVHLRWPSFDLFIIGAAVIGTVPLLLRALPDLARGRITIDVFNLFALSVSFVTGELASAAFIILMITGADLLDWRTKQRSKNAVEQLLKLKPQVARRETRQGEEQIPISQIRSGDILVVPAGEAVPADGTVIGGEGDVNEAFVTGESVPVHKTPGSHVLISSVVESGALKVRAVRVGEESTIDRMAKLIREATANKSRPERLADEFAGIFLPFIIIFGSIVYLVTHDVRMTAALFLVACADDLAFAIPLAITASLGQAARRGVVVKGGAVMEVMSRIRTVVLDKTGTLTYGRLRFHAATIVAGVDEHRFWLAVGTANKFSDHPISRAMLHEAYRHEKEIPDPDRVEVHKGIGIVAHGGDDVIAVGNRDIAAVIGVTITAEQDRMIATAESVGSSNLVYLNGSFIGVTTVTDTPRAEAADSLRELARIGIKHITIFTGDNESVARRVAAQLHIDAVRSRMKPEDKLRALGLISETPVMMVGDGINDAPALARADVGVAMGGNGTAIASEAADAIVLTDNLARLPEMILLARKTISVIKWDVALWAISNSIGFALVLTGLVGPAMAAFYNFATDFLPLINSARLFRRRS